jgi:RimJ/RimL family protein N-acetyltransferase
LRASWSSLAKVDGRWRKVGQGLGRERGTPSKLEVTLSNELQGVGSATEAFRSALAWSFSDFDIHRVFAHVEARNAPARALLTSLGLRQEAELREADWFKGEWTTLCIYAVLGKERSQQANG